jgi:tetratricopeptide (TPR) repeat protein
MAQPATTAKLEELRFKLKTDPKSRLFYQLAEELRKAGHYDEAEHALRSGLIVYPTYLAAWVSLGRTLREKKNDAGAAEALNKALQLDPGNVVAARILADAYLALGDKVEAIKKYKLVHALLPSDEDLRVQIEKLERDLKEPEPVHEPEVAAASEIPAEAIEEVPDPILEMLAAPQPMSPFEEDSPFDRTMPPFAEAERVLEEEARVAEETGDAEPMAVAHEESPFEEPVGTYNASALTIEAPIGMHIESAPAEAEVAAPVFEEDEQPAAVETTTSDAANTATMADLYARQGLVDDARHIYENILARDPGNADVRAKLERIAPRVNAKVAMLERWLSRVARREVPSV